MISIGAAFIHSGRRIVGPSEFFDAAKRQVCEVKPQRTNTPMHALNILNNVTYVEAARALAQRVLSESGDETDKRLRLAGRLVLVRDLTNDEMVVMRRSVKRAMDHFSADEDAAGKFLSHGDSVRDEKLNLVEHAAWTGGLSELIEPRRDFEQRVSTMKAADWHILDPNSPAPLREHQLRSIAASFLAAVQRGLGSLPFQPTFSARMDCWQQRTAKLPVKKGLPGVPHFAPKAKRVIYLFQNGGPHSRRPV